MKERHQESEDVTEPVKKKNDDEEEDPKVVLCSASSASEMNTKDFSVKLQIGRFFSRSKKKPRRQNPC